MTTTKKLVVAVVALSLALVSVVGATLAFLIAESNEVVNTFTYGKIEIELWENDVDETGMVFSSSKVQSNTYVNVVPGDTLYKNPTVTVKDGSEDCYLYVLVTNNLVLDGAPVATYELKDGWEKVDEKGNAILYRCVKGNDLAQKPGDYTVFEEVTFDEDLTVADVAELAKIENGIVIQAYAHQSAHTDPDIADEAAIEWAWAIVDAVNP